MNSILRILSNLKRTLECVYFDRKNSSVLKDGHVVLRNFLTNAQIDELKLEYSFRRQDLSMNSDGADFRSVFYNTDPVAKMVMLHPVIAKILKDYSPAHGRPAFIMRNVIVDTSLEGSGGGWHRDSYRPTLKIFIPLSISCKKNGATVFVKQSHKWSSKIKDFATGPRVADRRIRPELASQPELRIGDVVVADTSCVHRGGKAIESGRDMLTVYYSHPGII